MNTEDQKQYILKIEARLKETGTVKGHFLKKVKISRTHWHFLKSGERPLIPAKKQAITQFFRNW